MTAKWIKTDGTITEVTPKDGVGFSLEELYEYIKHPKIPDPMVETQTLRSKGLILCCEENAMAYDLEPNNVATMECAVDVIQPDKGILGNVLICHPSQLE